MSMNWDADHEGDLDPWTFDYSKYGINPQLPVPNMLPTGSPLRAPDNRSFFSKLMAPFRSSPSKPAVKSHVAGWNVAGANGMGSGVKDKVATKIEVDPAKGGSRLEVKRLDLVLDRLTGAYVRRESQVQKPTVQVNEHAEYAFILLREFKQTRSGTVQQVVTKYEIQSPQLRKIGEKVIGREMGVSWTSATVSVEPTILMAFLPQLEEHLTILRSKQTQAASPDEDLSVDIEHLAFFVGFINTEHAEIIKEVKSLLANNEISFDLAWAIFVPRTILYVPCPVSGAPRAVRLIKAVNQSGWNMEVEYMEHHGKEPLYGLAPLSGITVPKFKGTMKITSLAAYPLKYHPKVEELTKTLIERGKKWCSLQGVYLKYYNAMGFQSGPCGYMKLRTQSRIVIDKETFKQIQPNYYLPMVTKTLLGEDLETNLSGYPVDAMWGAVPAYTPIPPPAPMGSVPDIPYTPPPMVGGRVAPVNTRHQDNSFNATPPTTDDIDPENPPWKDLSDDDLLLASPLVYGFSLADKSWMEFSVEDVHSFTWNDESFSNLVLPRDQKSLVLSLVEAHMQGTPKGFDDFVEGKGQGLVINIFGNPGIGKSLTAEATSEHVRKPLYVVGAGDLGTQPHTLDQNLTRIFTISSRWGAVVLIDEADVFLEERSLHDLTRNAMVSVFLRQLEYFRGILFLTTNRVRTFDRAFQSRIHVSLRYLDLSADAKRQIWVAFLRKAIAGLPRLEDSRADASEADKFAATAGLSYDELRELGEKPVNGRQIKNVVRTASALATARKQPIGFKHLDEVLGMMEQFEVANAMYQ